MDWIEYAAKMPTGIPTEVDCLEFSLTRGDCHVRCLMLEKFGEDDYVFHIERPTRLVHMEDAIREVDEDGNYMPLEEVDGENCTDHKSLNEKRSRTLSIEDVLFVDEPES